MLEIMITNGGIKTKRQGGKTTTLVTWPKEKFEFPCNQYSYLPPVGLMSCEKFYDGLKAEGYSGEAIIFKMIRLYIPWFQFNIGHLEKISKIIGLIGHRGSCKTASAVYMLIFDYLIRDLPVFSNVDIAVKVRYRDAEKVFTSRPWQGTDMLDIDGDCRGGCVFVDEINLSAAESTRHMASANLAWSNDLQQLRKKQLNVIWTAQGWSTVDNRTRWQTDYVIECQDCFNDHSYRAKCPGDKTKWQVYELSGLSGEFDLAYELEHRFLMHYKIGETQMIWLRPISWPAYDTFQAQDADYIRQYKLKQATTDRENKEAILTARHENDQQLVDGIVKDSFYASDFWEQVGAVGDKTRQALLGRMISLAGYKRKRDSMGYYYIRGANHEQK